MYLYYIFRTIKYKLKTKRFSNDDIIIEVESDNINGILIA